MKKQPDSPPAETVSLDTLKPNPRNPRTITNDALDKLCTSIKRDPQFMELRPIVTDDEGMVLGGNQRLSACRKLGMTEVPASWVRKASGLTEEQRKRFVIVDNAPQGMAGDWDNAVLLEDWTEQQLNVFGIDETQSEEGEITQLEVRPLKMAWLLVGVPLGSWSQVQPMAERAAEIQGSIVETSSN